jgi:hypothetical protein
LSSLDVAILGRQLLFLGSGGVLYTFRSLLAAMTFLTAAAFLFSLFAISLAATLSQNNAIMMLFSATSNWCMVPNWKKNSVRIRQV